MLVRLVDGIVEIQLRPASSTLWGIEEVVKSLPNDLRGPAVTAADVAGSVIYKVLTRHVGNELDSSASRIWFEKARFGSRNAARYRG